MGAAVMVDLNRCLYRCALLLPLLAALQTPYIKLSENSWAVRLSRNALAFTYDI